jgi:hypothetical protein
MIQAPRQRSRTRAHDLLYRVDSGEQGKPALRASLDSVENSIRCSAPRFERRRPDRRSQDRWNSHPLAECRVHSRGRNLPRCQPSRRDVRDDRQPCHALRSEQAAGHDVGDRPSSILGVGLVVIDGTIVPEGKQGLHLGMERNAARLPRSIRLRDSSSRQFDSGASCLTLGGPYATERVAPPRTFRSGWLRLELAAAGICEVTFSRTLLGT